MQSKTLIKQQRMGSAMPGERRNPIDRSTQRQDTNLRMGQIRPAFKPIIDSMSPRFPFRFIEHVMPSSPSLPSSAWST